MNLSIRSFAPLALCGALLSVLTGCESGKEVASVARATAETDPQGKVAVTALLTCQLVYGMGRASGCDADDSDVCVRAEWYDATDTAFERSFFKAHGCAHQGAIQGAKMVVTSEVAIPKDSPKKIRIQTEPQLDSRDDRLVPIVIDSP